jgi:hypothetical protein
VRIILNRSGGRSGGVEDSLRQGLGLLKTSRPGKGGGNRNKGFSASPVLLDHLCDAERVFEKGVGLLKVAGIDKARDNVRESASTTPVALDCLGGIESTIKGRICTLGMPSIGKSNG